MSEALDVFLLFTKLGLMAFGAGSAVLGDMQREVVSRGWMTQLDFVHAYAVNQLLPGPQMMFVAVVGFYGAGLAGALAAAAGFMGPPALLMLLLATISRRWANSPWADTVRRSFGPIAVGLTASGVYVMTPGALSSPGAGLIFVGAIGWLAYQPNRSPLFVVFGGVLAGIAAFYLIPR